MRVPEMPKSGETLLCGNYQLFPGGKGANQAVAAANVCSHVTMIGAVGNDHLNVIALDSLQKAGVDLNHIRKVDDASGCAVIFVDDHANNMISVASGANKTVTQSNCPDNLLTEQTTLLCQMELNANETFALIKKAHQKGCRIILNLAPACSIPDDVLECLSVLVINQHEAEFLARDLDLIPGNVSYLDSLESAVSIAHALSQAYGLSCVITLGDKGAIVASSCQVFHVPPLNIDAVDTTGAGDCFVGTLAASLDDGDSLKTALQKASIAGSLACQKLGAQSSYPKKEDILLHLETLCDLKRVS